MESDCGQWGICCHFDQFVLSNEVYSNSDFLMIRQDLEDEQLDEKLILKVHRLRRMKAWYQGKTEGLK